MSRSLYLAAYDIRDHRRLARACKYFKTWRVAGQKSVPELWLTAADLQRIRREITDIIDTGEDSLHILALDPRMHIHCLGLAASHSAPHFCVL